MSTLQETKKFKKNKANYTIPDASYEVKGVSTPLVDKFIDALIKQQFMCADFDNESYENQLNCSIAKQKLFKAYKEMVFSGHNEFPSDIVKVHRANEVMFSLKKITENSSNKIL